MMNFSAFGGPFSGIHQFAAKFSHNEVQSSPNSGIGSGAFTAPSSTALINGNINNNSNNNLNGNNNISNGIHTSNYGNTVTNGNHFQQNHTSVANTMQYGQNISIPYSQPQTDLNFLTNANQDHKPKIHPKIERDREEVINQQILQNVNQSWQTLANTANTVDYSSHLLSATLPISIQHFLKYSETIKKESTGIVSSQIQTGNFNLGSLESTTSGGFNVKSEILKNGTNLASLALGGVSQLTNSGIYNNHPHQQPQTQQLQQTQASLSNGIGLNGNHIPQQQQQQQQPHQQQHTMPESTTTMTNTPSATTTLTAKGKPRKQKKKKPPKEKKPRPKPGEIRETTALDGSTLYCCPECQMAYPDRSLIEQHVISHAVERRFVCDVCNAALKRKDHLTRHKLSHIPDRPHVCNICLKSFKRKEQLTLHIVIHSGEKKHVCQECGKGFYRKDHLRKHTRSHIARRVKSEVSQQTATPVGNNPTTQSTLLQPS